MTLAIDQQVRRKRMAILARSHAGRLQELWSTLGMESEYRPLRGPETGLVMLRGRIGGTGEAFNLGEATVTRATVKLANGAVGHAMALGRDAEKVCLAAIIDAHCHDQEAAAAIDERVIAPMRAELEATDEKRRQETAATRVDFFTMVRGED